MDAPRAVRVVVAALVCATLAVGGAAGCADGPEGETTTPLEEGSIVSAQRYLADVDAAAAALREFSSLLEALPAPVSADALRAASPGLAAVFERADAIVDRLEAQRLEDARLERQRAEAVPVLRELLGAMDAVFTQANRGRVVLAAEAVDDFRAGLERLGALGAP